MEQENEYFSISGRQCRVANSEHLLLKTVGVPYKLISADGLSYLIGQPDESAVVFSSRTLRGDTMFKVGLPPELAIRYSNGLIDEIARVTPKMGYFDSY